MNFTFLERVSFNLQADYLREMIEAAFQEKMWVLHPDVNEVNNDDDVFSHIPSNFNLATFN